MTKIASFRRPTWNPNPNLVGPHHMGRLQHTWMIHVDRRVLQSEPHNEKISGYYKCHNGWPNTILSLKHLNVSSELNQSINEYDLTRGLRIWLIYLHHSVLLHWHWGGIDPGSLIPTWISNHMPSKVWDELIHSQTSTVRPLKFVNE